MSTHIAMKDIPVPRPAFICCLSFFSLVVLKHLKGQLEGKKCSLASQFEGPDQHGREVTEWGVGPHSLRVQSNIEEKSQREWVGGAGEVGEGVAQSRSRETGALILIWFIIFIQFGTQAWGTTRYPPLGWIFPL